MGVSVSEDFFREISIHAPREGGDLSPLPRRPSALTANFNPRPPRGGRPTHDLQYGLELFRISIHAPREGGDGMAGRVLERGGEFQSTPPARGATTLAVPKHPQAAISIHAPREGGDGVSWWLPLLFI